MKTIIDKIECNVVFTKNIDGKLKYVAIYGIPKDMEKAEQRARDIFKEEEDALRTKY